MASSSSVYIYNPTTTAFTNTSNGYSNYGVAPDPSKSLVLTNGKILFSEYLGNSVQVMELFDPSGGTWSTPYGLIDSYYYSGNLTPLLELSNGTILTADFGYFVGHFYDPITHSFSTDHPKLIYYHGAQPATAILQNGKILIVGGNGAEYFNP